MLAATPIGATGNAALLLAVVITLITAMLLLDHRHAAADPAVSRAART